MASDPIIHAMDEEEAYGSVWSKQYTDAARASLANETARRMGMNPDTVEAALPDMMNEDRLRKRIAETRRVATYAQIMAKPRVAAAAMDDDHLANIAQKVGDHVDQLAPLKLTGGDVFNGGSIWENAKDAGNILALTGRHLFGSVAGALGTAGNTLNAIDEHSRFNGGRGITDPLTIHPTAPFPLNLLSSVASVATQALIGSRAPLNKVANDPRNTQQTTSRDVNDAFLSAADSIPSSLAALGVTVATGGAAGPVAGGVVGATAIGFQTFGQTYEQARQEGLNPNDAMNYAMADMGWETGTEIGPEMLLGKFFGEEGQKNAKTLFRAAGFEFGGEGLATPGQGFDRWYWVDRHKGQTFNQFLATLPDQERSTMVSVASIFGVTAGAGHIAQKAGQRFVDRRSAKNVDDIMKAAENSPTRKNNPSDFQDAFSQVLTGTHAEHLYVPARAIQDLFAAKEAAPASGDKPAVEAQPATDIREHPFFSQFADQVEQEAPIGGTVIIPTAAAITHLPGTTEFQQLREAIRYSPGGSSIAEAKQQQTPEELAKTSEKAGKGVEAIVSRMQQGKMKVAVQGVAKGLGMAGEHADTISEWVSHAMHNEFTSENTARVAAGEAPVSVDEYVAKNLPRVEKTTQAEYEKMAATGDTLGATGATHGQDGSPQGNRGDTAQAGAVSEPGRLRGEPRVLDGPSRQGLGPDQPLAGAPQTVTIPGHGEVAVRPYAPARAAAAQHMRDTGMNYAPATTYAKVDAARATRIANAFDAMKHSPNDPLVRAAYDQMISETLEQFQHIKETGLTIEFIKPGQADPYLLSPRLAIEDVHQNNHLWVFPTDAGFGEGEDGIDLTDHPMMAMTDEVIDGQQLRANDVFRIVHDFYGHIKDGNGFRATGEENAWQSHAAMFSPLARRAMTTETRGQNSWVNYGPFGEQNQKASSANTKYAPQKVGLMPEWTSEEGYLGGDNGQLGQHDQVAGSQSQNGNGRANGDTLAQSAALESPPVNDKGETTLVHFSLEDGLDQTHPDAWGRSGRFLSDEERVRRKIAPPRTYFGIAPGEAGGYRIEFPIVDGQRVHPLYRSPVFRVQAQFPLQNLYDMNADPDGLKAIGRALPKNRQGRYEYKGINLSSAIRGIDGESLYEHLIKDAGYDGYWIKDDQIGMVAAVFTPVDVTQVTDTFDQSAVDIQHQPLKVAGSGPGGQVTNEDMYHALNERQRAVYGRELDPMNSEGDYKTVVRALVDEHGNQRETGDDGEGWYKEDVNRAIELTKEIFPELDDPMNRDMFLIVTAILSPKQSPVPNWDNAMHAMAGYFNDGNKFALERPSGLEFGVASHKTGLQILQHLVDTMGSMQAIEWLQSNHTGRELAEVRREVGVFKGGDKTRPVKDFLARDVALGDTVPGMAIFGPKVSNFAANVTGIDQSLVTVDSWAASTYNRITGQLLKGDPQAPRGKAERKLMQRLFTDAANEVGITPSAFQAQLWYFEQRLYRNHGIDAPSTSFSEAAEKAALERGANPDRLVQRLAARESQNAGRGADALFTANGEPNQGLNDPQGRDNPNTLNQEITPSQEVFYSNAQRAVEQAKMEKASPQQWKALLTPGRTPGIKAEEIEWTDIGSWLDIQKGSIDKAALLQVLRDRGLEVQEVVLGRPMEDKLADYGYDIADMNDMEHEANLIAEDNNAQFQSWSSDPSNDTYRELLITLPLGEQGNPDRAASTHWEPDGVVAHARFMDKTDAEGKRVLFVEEVQSDWHQKGRDQGYDVDLRKNYDAALKANALAGAEVGRLAKELGIPNAGRSWSEDVKALKALEPGYEKESEVAQALLRFSEVNQALQNTKQPSGIPDAPFKSSWPALVMKRMIRYAAENGYDKVAWTTGEEQAQRYNLSQAVGALTLEGMHDSSGYRVRMSTNAAYQLAQNRTGEIVEHNGRAGETTLRMTEGQMKEAFGNDIAERVINSDGEPVSGEGLRVGGEGMKAFYDRNLVNITNDLIKKYGGKVEAVNILNPHAQIKAHEDGIYFNQIHLENAIREGNQAEIDLRRGHIARGEEKIAQAKAGDPHSGFTITPDLREAALAGMPMFQQEGQPQKRGNISFTRENNDPAGMMTGALIRAFESANFSTAVHELGHFFLERLRNRALRSNALPQDRADWEAYKAWVGNLGLVFDDNSPIPRDAHEYFARGVERFVWEGEAPSKALRSVFTRMREFMLKLYKHATDFNAPITPEIRDVMGRIFASQQEIDAQTEDMNLSSKAVRDLLSPAEQKAYDDLGAEAKQDANDTLMKRTLSGLRRQKRAEAAQQKRAIKSEVEGQVASQPVMRALSLLRVGIPQPDGSHTKARLSREWLVDTYGPDIEAQMPQGVPPIVSDNNTMDADHVATLAGFDSGDAMVKALVAHEATRQAMKASGDDRSPAAKAVDDAATARMAAEVGDPYANIEEEAQAAIANDKQAEQISMELRALARKTGKRFTLWQAAKEFARLRIQSSTTSQILTGKSLQVFAREIAAAGHNAQDALVKGDFTAAQDFRQQQLVSMAHLQEAKKAKELVEAAVKRMLKIAKRTTSPSIDQDYLEQAQAILEDVDLKERSGKAVERIKSFADWHAAQVKLGIDVFVPPGYRELLGKNHYTTLPVEELLELDTVVGQIIELGRLKKTLRDGKTERDFDEGVTLAVDRAEQQRERKVGDEYAPGRTVANRAKARVRSIDAAMIKAQQLITWLDGGDTTGPWHRLIYNPLAAAQGRSDDLHRAYATRMNEIVTALPKALLKGLTNKVDTPELINRIPGHKSQGQPFSFRMDEIVLMAANWGTEGNRQRLLDGFGWQEHQVKAVLDRLMTKEHWQFVSDTWATINQLWPDLEALERRVNGIAPEKITGVPIQTPHGEIMGAYFPIVYNPIYSTQVQLDEASKLSPHGAWHNVNTRAGSTHSRLERVTGRPLLLSMGVITNHMSEVIHDITHREAVMQVRKLLSDPRIRASVESRFGHEYLKTTLEEWLEDIATPNTAFAKAPSLSVWAGRGLTAGVSTVGLGLRISTILQQPLGMANLINMIGSARMGQGLAVAAMNPLHAWNFVHEKSAEMRARFSNIDANVQDMIANNASKLRKIGGTPYAFKPIMYMDATITISGWIGAYNQGLAGQAPHTSRPMTEEEAIAYADEVITSSQGAGGRKDRSSIMREHPVARLFYPFFSYASAWFSQQRDAVRTLLNAENLSDVGDGLRKVWWVWVVPAVLQALFFGQGPDPDDDGKVGVEEWLKWLLRSMVTGNAYSLPILGPAVNAIAYGYGYSSSALQGVGKDAVKSVENLYALAHDPDAELSSATIRSVFNTVGVAFRQPLGQPGAAVSGLYDYEQGKADPQSAGDWYNLLTKGRIPDKPTAIQVVAGADPSGPQ